MQSSRPGGAPASKRSATEVGSAWTGGLANRVDADQDDSGSFAVGELLVDRFEIVRWIASGGMGDVYEAWDRELGERVAVKTIRQEIASDRQAMDRFRREISLARKVTHSGVCRIFDVFFHAVDDTSSGGSPSDGAIAFLTMELLDGPTLTEHLRESGPMSVAEAWPLVRQMAEALAAAHEAGVVHRDFKPSNVLLVGGSQGVRAVVSDFGLARQSQIGSGADVTAPGEVLGSPAYMAPEQATGGHITPATDVYSLGVTIFQVITGRLPFEAASPLATLVKRVKEDPPSPSVYARDLDPRWEAAILKCLARDPEERFSEGAAVAPALAPGAPRSMRSRRLRRRLRWAEGVLVLILLVAGVAHLPIFRRPPVTEIAAPAESSSRLSVAVLGFKNLSGRQEADWLATALTELLATELAAGEGLRTVPGENVARMKLELAVQVTDGLAADTLRSIGQHLNTHYVVLGSYFATGEGAGNRLRLDLRIQDTKSGETLATLSETATEAGVLGLIARMGAHLRRSLGIDHSPVEEVAIEGATLPSNPVAARFYAQGLDELRGFRALAARDLLRRSISADPDYALSYAALSEALGTLGYDAEAVEQITIAFELSADLPREERLQVEGQYHERMLAWDQTIEIYQTLAEDYPDSLEYGLNLVQAQMRGDRRQDAEKTLERLRALPPGASDDPRIDLVESELAGFQAQYPRALEAATKAMETGRRQGARLLAARAQSLQGRALWRLGRLDEAVEVARESERVLFELGDLAGSAKALNLCGKVLCERGDLEAASTVYQQALRVFRQIGFRAGIEEVLKNQAILLEAKAQLDGVGEPPR